MTFGDQRGQAAPDMPWNRDSSARSRTTRAQGTRERETRAQQWQEPSSLPVPDKRSGLVHRWIRISALNNADNMNAHKQLSEGWTPCRLEDYPELNLEVDPEDNRFAAKGNVVTGGLMLCCMSEEVAKQRIEHYKKMSRNQMQGIDSHYLRENDERMPLLKPHRTSRTTFA